jgi:hypothetical protein
MTRRFLLLFFPLILSAALVRHTWDKPDSEWKEAEAKTIVSDSPWAKATAITGGDKAIIRWEDSEPVRRALQRLGMTPAIGNAEQYYALALSARLSELPESGSRRNWTARLTVPGNWNLEASEVRVVSQSQNSAVVFLFPKQGPLRQPNLWSLPFGIILPSWNAEFRARVGSTEIVQRFPLHRMWYMGRIEL